MIAKTHDVQIYKKRRWNLKTEWRWRIKADNGRIIGASSEGYRNKQDMIYNMISVLGSLRYYLKEEDIKINYKKAK